MMRACPCGGRITDQTCDRCGPVRTETRRKTADRGYDARWRKVAAAHLRQHPVCVCCEAQGMVNGARGRTGLRVDHIVPVRMAPDRLLDRTNLQSLCLSCDAGFKMPLEDSCEDGGEVVRKWTALLGRMRRESQVETV